jgi:ABC-type cobalamin/Fe3+-siderophores transport system ATPase subunit
MIKINNVEFGYKKNKKVLKNINFEIQENEMIAVIGKNGSR